MSIIYDALKKVESTNAAQPAEPDKKDISPKPKQRFYLIYILVASLGLFIANSLFGFLSPTNKPLKEQIKPLTGLFKTDQDKKKSGPALIVIAPTKPKAENKAERSEGLTGLISNIKREASPSLVLNGIFFSDSEGYALINNQIVKVGDTVGTAKVKSITVDEVELDNAGSVVKLSTRSGS
ncbi:MAG TPA: hypothetical protein VMD04_05420 [Candidatus Margulisiibacteriota bacterium]|nr:hypothetical protein [Candidatus Margulisiibacteriota bacterium]